MLNAVLLIGRNIDNRKAKMAAKKAAKHDSSQLRIVMFFINVIALI